MDTHRENVKQLNNIFYKDIYPLYTLCVNSNCENHYKELAIMHDSIYNEEMIMHEVYMNSIYDELSVMLLPPSCSFFHFHMKVCRLLEKVNHVKKILAEKSHNDVKCSREVMDEELINVKKIKV